mmetsp:Transcript_4262/g.6371  ORF Transcript_4262/g.6371 Transcript_4262/m.6371 type:complete len:206 (-) Transcript_4262:345-962(-)
MLRACFLAVVVSISLASVHARGLKFGAIMVGCAMDCEAFLTIGDDSTMEEFCAAFNGDFSCMSDCGSAAQIPGDDEGGDDDEPLICPGTAEILDPEISYNPAKTVQDFYESMCAVAPCMPMDDEDDDGQMVNADYFCDNQTECGLALYDLYVDIMGATSDEVDCFTALALEEASCDDVRNRKLKTGLKKLRLPNFKALLSGNFMH